MRFGAVEHLFSHGRQQLSIVSVVGMLGKELVLKMCARAAGKKTETDIESSEA